METLTLFAAVTRYWCRLVPFARKEIAHWAMRAASVQDPVLRQIAVAKISAEHLNVESAAFFALLAGHEWRAAVRRIVAFQLAYELLDGLNEQTPKLADGLRLHGALVEAVGGPRSAHGGGCYLQELVDACRELALPSEEMTVATRNVGMAQSLNHAGQGLREWAELFAPRLPWWEAAAAGISSLGILALLVTPPTTHRQIVLAYTEICALSALLDALVDYPRDVLTGNHNWLSHYESTTQAADRLIILTHAAQRALRGIPAERLHLLLLAGLIAHNLTPKATREDHAREARSRLMRILPLVRLGVRVLQVRRVVLPG